MDADRDRAVQFRIEVPDERLNGVYANFLSVWSSAHDFTLDFAVTGQPEQTDDAVTVPARVVARVKIPITIAQNVLRAMAAQVASYEAVAGPIRTPGDDQPMYPPEDMR